MFTKEQVMTAHSKVKSGADFPSYIQEIKQLGVSHYESYVADGHIDYHGGDQYTVKVPEKYDSIVVSDTLNTEAFKENLKAHQLGKTDYLTFIKMCAETGIEKWKINIETMNCTYFDKAGNEVLTEQIPA